MDEEKLKKEEQLILNELLTQLNRLLISLDNNLSFKKRQEIELKKMPVAELYGLYLDNLSDQRDLSAKRIETIRTKGELYNHRILVDVSDADSDNERMEMKIGMHSFVNAGDIYVYDYRDPVCRHYILDGAEPVFKYVFEPNSGNARDMLLAGIETTFKLIESREIDVQFDKVRGVIKKYPLTEEEAELVADAFLKELLNRRELGEFKNIVFSIQKQQSGIIQLDIKKDIIVQGCAGSGKSMIMLHRLPILLYDHKDLNRTGVFIISPSQAYIQMAENMMADLEIDDLPIGTLKQYYDRILGRYGISSSVYGEYDPAYSLSEIQQDYLYSEECIADINNMLSEKISTDLDILPFQELLDIRPSSVNIVTKYDKLNSYVLNVAAVHQESKKRLDDLCTRVIELADAINRLANVLNGIGAKIGNTADKYLSDYTKRLDNIEKELEEVAETNDEKRFDELAEEESNLDFLIKSMNNLKAKVNAEKCFNEINDISDTVKAKIKEYLLSSADLSLEDKYRLIENRKAILEVAIEFDGYISMLDPDYAYYYTPLKDNKFIFRERYQTLLDDSSDYLSINDYKLVSDEHSRLVELKNNIVDIVYDTLVADNNLKPKNWKRRKGISVSPYLYLQILLNYRGVPNTAYDSIIAIDEAQGLAVSEIRLIRKLNPGAKLNLYGDIMQHIEGTKGIDNWGDLNSICDFDINYMRENYRNATQITEYCNKTLRLDMIPINLPGRGVHELSVSDQDFYSGLEALLIKRRKGGYAAVIVKDNLEAKYILDRFSNLEKNIYSVFDNGGVLHENRWNIITVENSKGLEFSSVIAFVGRMTHNEQYISFTRALDELHVIKGELDLTIASGAENDTDKEVEIITKKQTRVLVEEVSDFTDSQLRKHFENEGVEVIDERPEGFLWVLGDETKISAVINDAKKKFVGLSGKYEFCKSAKKNGWYTKSKR